MKQQPNGNSVSSAQWFANLADTARVAARHLAYRAQQAKCAGETRKLIIEAELQAKTARRYDRMALLEAEKQLQ